MEKPADATALLQAARAAPDANAGVTAMLAQVLVLAGSAKDAVATLASLPADRTPPPLWSALARAQEVAGDRPAAIRTLRTLVSLVPDSPDPVLDLAATFQRNGDGTAAEAALAGAWTRFAGDNRVLRRLVAFTLSQGGIEQALRLTESLRTDPATAEVGAVLHGETLLQAHRVDQAIAAFQADYARSPKSESPSRLAGALLLAGRPEEAAALLRERLTDHSSNKVSCKRRVPRRRFGMTELSYRALFASIMEGLALCELIRDEAGQAMDWRYLDVNDSFERQAEVDRDAVVGRTFREAFPGTDPNPWLRTYQVSVDEQRSITFEDDWGARSIAGTATPLGGQRFALVYRDVTEQKTAADALRASEARYQALFAGSPVPFMVLDADPPQFTILAANEAYYKATLTTPETLIGRRLFDVFTDDPRRPGQLGSEALGASLARVLRTKQADTMSRVRYDLVTPFGYEPHWWLAINAPLLDADGNVTTIIHQVDRQTELHHAEEGLRASEERFRALVTAGGNSIYRMSADWRLMFQLDSTTLAATAEPIEDWIGKYIPAEDLPRVRAAVAQAIRTKSLFELEHRVLQADGSIGWVLSRAVPLLGFDGTIVEWFGAASDATERRRAVELARESQDRFRTLADTAPALIWFNDQDGKNTFVNQVFVDYTGRSPEQIAGETWRGLIDPDHEEEYVAG